MPHLQHQLNPLDREFRTITSRDPNATVRVQLVAPISAYKFTKMSEGRQFDGPQH